MATIRAFIAIELPAPVRSALVEAGRKLERGLERGAVRWVKPEAMHLTLRFLGDTDVKLLPGLGAAMDGLSAGRAPFEMRLGGLGCFPNARRPRVIWVGLRDDAGQAPAPLLALKRDLDAALRPFGFDPEDKPFQAHLTLGRVREDGRIRDLSLEAAVPDLAMTVAALHLIESDLRPEGPRYTVRRMAALTG